MKQRVLRGITALAVVFGTTFGAVLPAYAALGAPSNLTLVGGVYTNDTTPTFTWTRPNGATWYEFAVDDGDWQGISNVSSYTLWPLSNGWHGFFLRAHDGNGEVSVSTSITFEIDTKGPSVPALLPGEATVNRNVTYSVTPSGEAATTSCIFFADGVDRGRMSNSYGTFSKSYTFSSTGSHVVYAKCTDGDGNSTVGATRTVTVSRGIPYGDDGIGNVVRGTLVKTSCGSYAPASDRCHSIYYYGLDGKRHPISSEAVYRSWFGTSYADVVTISNSTMDRLSTGKNVTMRPGTALIKFSGSATVYAVEKGGVLRAIANEAVAKAIYGSHWANAVVTFPGSMKAEYSFGKKISSSSDYSKTRAYYSVENVDDNF